MVFTWFSHGFHMVFTRFPLGKSHFPWFRVQKSIDNIYAFHIINLLETQSRSRGWKPRSTVYFFYKPLSFLWFHTTRMNWWFGFPHQQCNLSFHQPPGISIDVWLLTSPGWLMILVIPRVFPQLKVAETAKSPFLFHLKALNPPRRWWVWVRGPGLGKLSWMDFLPGPRWWIYPLVMTNIATWKMAIEIVEFPIKHKVDLSIVMLNCQRVAHIFALQKSGHPFPIPGDDLMTVTYGKIHHAIFMGKYMMT